FAPSGAICSQGHHHLLRWFAAQIPGAARLGITHPLLGHASGCAVLRIPSFARVLAVAARGPSVQALVKLAATLRLSLASGSLDGSSCSLTSAAHSSALPDGDASYRLEAALIAAQHRTLKSHRASHAATSE